MGEKYVKSDIRQCHFLRVQMTPILPAGRHDINFLKIVQELACTIGSTIHQVQGWVQCLFSRLGLQFGFFDYFFLSSQLAVILW